MKEFSYLVRVLAVIAFTVWIAMTDHSWLWVLLVALIAGI
jgi:hypothetical protein